MVDLDLAHRLDRALATVRPGRRLALDRRLPLRAFQHRILFELLLDEGIELQVGELQQLDRLLQLRRHHQGLGGTKLLLLG